VTSREELFNPFYRLCKNGAAAALTLLFGRTKNQIEHGEPVGGHSGSDP